MVERFNRRISELLKQTRFDSRADLETTLLTYLKLYNHHIPQRAIGSKTPIQALKEWQYKNHIYSSNALMTKRDLTHRDQVWKADNFMPDANGLSADCAGNYWRTNTHLPHDYPLIEHRPTWTGAAKSLTIKNIPEVSTKC